MSVEVFSTDDGQIYLVHDTGAGFFIHRVGKPVARYDSYDEARRAILDGQLEVLS